MKNPVFKAQVATLFEKTSLGQDPKAVAAATTDPAVRGDIHRGLAMWEGAKDLAHGIGSSAGSGYRGVSKFLSPTFSEGGHLSRAVSGLGTAVSKNPRLATAAVGTAALAPILLRAFDTSQRQHEDELVNANTDPSRVILASLEKFIEKKAELYSMTKLAVVAKPAFSFSRTMGEGLGKGLGSALGGTAVGLLAQALGSGFSALHDTLATDPKRKALVDTVIRTDPVIGDAVHRHQDTMKVLKESYGTMVRFAPTLSMDINAVRSFLREAVMGGSGVNYATIKNLVDTERAIADAKPRYGQGH